MLQTIPKQMLAIFFLVPVSIFFSTTVARAQTPLSDLYEDFTYEFYQENGTNASAVAWDPTIGLYFTVIAGNSDYPLESFDINGRNNSTYKAEFDTRGMWFNSNINQMEMNGAGEAGWVRFKGNDPEMKHEVVTGMHQPDFQSVGTYDEETDCVVFFNDKKSTLVFYKHSMPAKQKSMKLKFLDANVQDFNFTTVCYTGVNNYEFLLLNTVQRELCFFNRKGESTYNTKLPDDAPVNPGYNFSYANKRVFLYNTATRQWVAYLIF